jgi:hypothetical protein
MKNIKILTVAGALGLVVCGIAIAQAHRGGTLHHALAQHHGNPAAVVEHLAQAFPKVAAFDVNKDGQLDDAEKEALGKAIADGSLELPMHNAPQGENPTEMLPHIAEMYAYVARYDVNHDGVLDESERAAITRSIENGEFAPHEMHRDGGAAE